MNSDTTIKQYNLFSNQNYEWKVVLSNSLGDVFDFIPTNFEIFTFTDTMESPFVKGYFICNNEYELLFNKNAGAYRFMGNGEDRLTLNIAPENFDGKLKPEVWNLAHRFVIYNTEDVEAADITKKKKKFYFIDEDFFALNTTVRCWSSTDITKIAGKETVDRTDEERKAPTGEILKYIIRLGNPNAIFSKEFDRGGGSLFYSSTTGRFLIDDLFYVMKKHRSERVYPAKSGAASDLCILAKDRYAGHWELRPFGDYFRKARANGPYAGDYQIETFVLDGTDDTKNKIPVNHSPDLSPDLFNVNITLTTSRINGTYQHIETTPIDSAEHICNTVSVGYDMGKNDFTITKAKTTIDSVMDFARSNYIDNLITYKNKNYTIPKTGPSTRQNYNYNVVNTLLTDSDDVAAEMRNGMLYNLFFRGDALIFDAPGCSIRQSGRFIALKRDISDEYRTTDDINNRILGQWFITSATHTFVKGTYTNRLVCNKIHSYYESF